jgi:hypothetical protein
VRQSSTRYADDAIVYFNYASNALGYIFCFVAHGPVAGNTRKGHFAIRGRHRDAVGRISNADMLGERRIDFCLQQPGYSILIFAASISDFQRVVS